MPDYFLLLVPNIRIMKKNLQFAKGLNNLLEKNYPGISRGIFEKK